MVLQRIEREGEAGSPLFGLSCHLTALMGKHGFAAKIQI